MVKQINRGKPDLVCIAGDIFDNEFRAVKDPEKIEKELRKIQSTYGTYACWGNHDIGKKYSEALRLAQKRPLTMTDRWKNFCPGRESDFWMTKQS